MPKQFGSGSTCHRRFQSWWKDGVFRPLFAALVGYCDVLRGKALLVRIVSMLAKMCR